MKGKDINKQTKQTIWMDGFVGFVVLLCGVGWEMVIDNINKRSK